MRSQCVGIGRELKTIEKRPDQGTRERECGLLARSASRRYSTAHGWTKQQQFRNLLLLFDRYTRFQFNFACLLNIGKKTKNEACSGLPQTLQKNNISDPAVYE